MLLGIEYAAPRLICPPADAGPDDAAACIRHVPLRS
jgi:hypothetical protein